MSVDPLLTALLAGRQLLEKANPELLAWTSEQWESWLRSQRTAEPQPMQPRHVAVAKLSCLEDLRLHVGLMQLLGSSALHCTVLLTFPTEGMARLARAQARRDEWQSLVHIMAEAQLAQALCGLAPNAALAIFPVPTILTPEALASIGSLFSNQETWHDGLSGDENILLGRAGDYFEWPSKQTPCDGERIATAFRLLLSQDPKHLSLAPDNSHSDGAPRMTCVTQATVRPHEGRVELTGLRDGGELLVAAGGNLDDRTVVVHQCVEIFDANERLQIRMPSKFLTTTPQPIRIESHGASGGLAIKDLLFHVPPARLRPWMLSAFLNRGGGGNPVIRAFARGVGCRIAYAEDEPVELQDIPVVWGVLRESDRILAQAKAQDLYFFYIDHAYFNRGHGKSYRITRNGYEAGAIRDCPADRIAELKVELQPWRRSGREVIVCPPTDYFVQAHGCPDWLETTLASLRCVTDRPITVRVKPQPGEEAIPLAQALETAHALVTHSSNVAIEAACLGTPVFVSPASAAAPVGLTDVAGIESPIYPDREPWLAHLAYNQFSFEEIGNGRAWRMLLELEEREFV